MLKWVVYIVTTAVWRFNRHKKHGHTAETQRLNCSWKLNSLCKLWIMRHGSVYALYNITHLLSLTTKVWWKIKSKMFLTLARNKKPNIRLTPVLTELRVCHFKSLGLLQLTQFANLVFGKCSGVILPAWNLYRIRIDSNSHRIQPQFNMTANLFSPFFLVSLCKL